MGTNIRAHYLLSASNCDVASIRKRLNPQSIKHNENLHPQKRQEHQTLICHNINVNAQKRLVALFTTIITFYNIWGLWPYYTLGNKNPTESLLLTLNLKKEYTLYFIIKSCPPYMDAMNRMWVLWKTEIIFNHWTIHLFTLPILYFIIWNHNRQNWFLVHEPWLKNLYIWAIILAATMYHLSLIFWAFWIQSSMPN